MAFTPSGYVPQTLDEIIADINQIFINVFGANVNLNPASVNGQFINQLAQLAQQNQNFMVILTASLYNPNVASGIWLGALCAFNGIVINPATHSLVTCICYGSATTVIPSGTLIQNTNNNAFYSTTDATIGSDGTVSVIFEALDSGAIPVDAGTVNNIITQFYGWDSVNNPSEGTIGQTLQSDNSLRNSRTALLSKYASASIGSLYSNLVQGLDLPTQYVFVKDNNTASTIIVAGVPLVANSIYVSLVATPFQYDTIAQIIYNKKCPGVNQNGNITHDYTDVVSGTVFTAQFDVPTPTPLQVNITYPIGTYPADFVFKIKTAIVNNFNGNDLTNAPQAQAVGINEIINVSRFSPSLLAVYPPQGGNYNSITIELATGGTPSPSILLPANEIGTLIISNVIVSFA